MGVTCARVHESPPRESADPPSVPVALHIYNIGSSRQIQVVNKLLREMNTGVFHCGVEVFGMEWSYSSFDCQPGQSLPDSGIFSCKPRQCPTHSYAETIPMGGVAISEDDIDTLINILRREWPVFAYHSLTKNCCHFCNELCQRLGLGKIPNWVMNLAGAGASILAAGDSACCRQLAGEGAAMLCCDGSSCPTSRRGSPIEADFAVLVEALPVLQPFGSAPDDAEDLKEPEAAEGQSPAQQGLGGLQPRIGRSSL